MPIEVELPDGNVVEFPDGTDTATMERALQQYSQAQQPEVRTWDAPTETVRAPTEELARSFGLGGRAMLQGAGDLVGIVADPFITGANEFLGTNQATMGQAATALADKIGLPAPETSTERVSGDVTRALTGGGGIMGLGRQLAARTPGVASRVGDLLASQPMTQISGIVGGSGAAGVTREAGGSQGAQLAAGVVGGLTPAGIRVGGAESIRRTVRGGEQGRKQVERAIGDFGAVGATPSVGQAAGNRRMQGIESLLAGGPTSGGVMARAAERQAEDIGGGLRQMADNFMPNASAERAGRAVERGAETFSNNVRATKKALYWQADQFIPSNTALPLSRTQQTLADLTRPVAGAEATTGALVNPRIAEIAQNVAQDVSANGGMPYEAVKALRTRIGEELTDYALSPDRPTAQYKRLYAALSQDMEEAARRQGPQAEAAAKRANNYTRAAADRLEQIQRVVDKNGGPEKVYNAVMSGTQDGGTTLRAVMQSLPEDGQRAVTAAVIKRMGLARPGAQDAAGEAFSANTFLTNWNRISPEARRALFDRHGPRFTQNMDKIARVADRIKSGSQVFANPSGTANRAAAITYAGSLAGSLLTGQVGVFGGLAAGGAGANLLARGMTSPTVVNWLAQATEAPVSAFPQMVALLKGAAQQEGDETAAEIASALEQQGVNQPANAGQ